MPQGPPEPEESDPFQETREAMKNHAPVQPRTYEKISREVMLGGGHINADMQQFLECDKKAGTGCELISGGRFQLGRSNFQATEASRCLLRCCASMR